MIVSSSRLHQHTNPRVNRGKSSFEYRSTPMFYHFIFGTLTGWCRCAQNIWSGSVMMEHWFWFWYWRPIVLKVSKILFQSLRDWESIIELWFSPFRWNQCFHKINISWIHNESSCITSQLYANWRVPMINNCIIPWISTIK